jgi:hypothetical protein
VEAGSVADVSNFFLLFEGLGSMNADCKKGFMSQCSAPFFVWTHQSSTSSKTPTRNSKNPPHPPNPARP